MEYNEAIKVITVVVNQHKHGYTITQADYNNYLDALRVLEVVKNKIEVTK